MTDGIGDASGPSEEGVGDSVESYPLTSSLDAGTTGSDAVVPGDADRRISQMADELGRVRAQADDQADAHHRRIMHRVIIGLTVIVVIVSAAITNAIVSGLSSSSTTVAPASTSEATSADPVGAAAVSISGIKGQKWSNALKILESRGADESDLLVLTNDGKTVVDKSNWTVSSISKDTATGTITVNLTHDSSATSDALNGAGSALSDAWSNISDGTAGLGRH